jgi:hypothetical protein
MQFFVFHFAGKATVYTPLHTGGRRHEWSVTPSSIGVIEPRTLYETSERVRLRQLEQFETRFQILRDPP